MSVFLRLTLGILLGGLLVSPKSCAQTVEQVRAAPPAIQFSDWREVDRDDLSVEYLVSFLSPLTTPYPANNVVPLRLVIPVDATGPVPVVLIAHYWGARDLRAERSLAADLNRSGVAAAILTLPYHLSRTPPGYRSGDLAIVPDPDRLKQSIWQAVLDSRRAIDFLQTRKEFRRDQVGLAGTSLGALVSSLTYAVEPRVSKAAFVLGGINFAHILWTSSRVVLQRDELRRKGFTEDRLRTSLENVEPGSYLPRPSPGSTLVIRGRYDTVIPSESSQALIDALGEPKVLSLDTGHYGGIFVQRKILREVATFFSQEFDGKAYVPPKRFVAPTIRIGLLGAQPGSVNLGAGIDLFHLDVRGNRFGTLFFTPRGIQVFAGQRLAEGIAFGLVGSPQNVGVGLFWSTIL